jgi:hypothetical protein
LQAKVQRDQLADGQYWYSEIASARASTPAMIDPDATATFAGSYLEP